MFRKLPISPLTLTLSKPMSVGDSRQGDAIVIGVNPENLAGTWFVQGRFLNANDDLEAVIGDSVAQSMYSPDPSKGIILSDPLVEGIDISK